MPLRFAEVEHRLTVRFASGMVVLTGIVLATIRITASWKPRECGMQSGF
jgi:hypothetical protein